MTDQPTPERTYLFRYGADMDPRRIRRELPDATFIARAHGEISGQDTWGIVLAVPRTLAEAASLPVLTDDGRALEAVVQTAEADLADPKAVLAQARYWELPLSYVRAWEAKVPEADVPA